MSNDTLPDFPRTQHVFDMDCPGLEKPLPCKWEYFDALRSAAEKQIAALTAQVDSLRNAAINKVMEASDEQITALNRMEGHDSDDIAKLGRQSLEIAALKLTIADLTEQIKGWKLYQKENLDNQCKLQKEINDLTERLAKAERRYDYLVGEARLEDLYDYFGQGSSSWDWVIRLPTGKSKGRVPPPDTPTFEQTIDEALNGK